MTKETAEKIVRGITDKIECNTADIDDWAEFWGFTREEYEEFLDMAIKALEQTRWIPVSERLPKDGDTYLVTIEYKGEVIGVDAASYSPVDGYIDKHWDTFNDWKEDDDSRYHVTAWMPLPSSYQGESEGE